jgi:hypothetical protein
MNHMNTKTLMGLGAVAAVALVAATVISSHRQPANEAAPQAKGYAIADLKEHLNDVRGVTVRAAEDKAVVTLGKSDKGWTVQEKGGYAADTGKLRDLLLKLADANLLEQKTANEQRYPDLGVEDVKSADAKGVKVMLDGLTKPAELIVGNVSPKSGGTFVRRPDDKQSWLAKGSITVDLDPANWIDKSVVDIGAERIAEIVLTKPGGKSVRLLKERQGDTTLKLAEAPAGREAATSVLSGLASTLSGLTLLDLAPIQATQMPADEKQLSAVYRTFDGLKINVWGWKQGDKHYVRFAVVLEQANAEAFIQADQAKVKSEFEAKQKEDAKAVAPTAVADPATDRERRLVNLAAEVSAMTQRLDGWVYVIPPYKFTNMEKSMDDLLKPLESAKPAASKADEKKSDVKKSKAKKT